MVEELILGDYEHSEAKGITDGKAQIAKDPLLRNRIVERTKGFFVELVKK